MACCCGMGFSGSRTGRDGGGTDVDRGFDDGCGGSVEYIVGFGGGAVGGRDVSAVRGYAV